MKKNNTLKLKPKLKPKLKIFYVQKISSFGYILSDLKFKLMK